MERGIKILSEFVRPPRLDRMKQVLNLRTFNRVHLVFERPHNEFNILACTRSADSFGVQNVHIIKAEKTKLTPKLRSTVSGGSNEWVNIHSYDSTKDCIKALKDKNFKILVTDIDSGAIPYDTLEKDIIAPTLDEESHFAFVFGSEKWGVSDEMLSLADHRWYLPMSGMAQSFNVSVSGASGGKSMIPTIRGGVLPEKRGLFRSDAKIMEDTLFRWLCISVDGFEGILKRHDLHVDQLAPDLRLRRGKIANWI